MKRYLIFGFSSQRGGVESCLMNYISNMMGEECTFEFIVFDKIPEYLQNAPFKECKMHIIPKRTNNPVKYYNKLKQILRKGRYDVLWYNVCTLSDITLLKIAKRENVPCRIVHSHNGANMGGKLVGFLHNKHKKIIEKYATDFFACSKVAAEFMFPESLSEKGEVKIINNAINTGEYKFSKKVRAKVRDSLGLTSQLLIGNVGRFHFQKNHKFILDIFAEVLKKKEDARLLLIGSGELKDEFCKSAKEKKVLSNIFILENRSDVNELLQAMDVFLFPSLFEGLPLSLIEAQTADLPCVISDTISDEVLITDRNLVLSLKDSAERWAKEVIEKGNDGNRTDMTAVMKSHGYDIYENAKLLINYIDN